MTDFISFVKPGPITLALFLIYVGGANSSMAQSASVDRQSSEFLTIPLAGYDHGEERIINSVMDHSVPDGWYSDNADGVVTAFSGETGDCDEYGSDPLDPSLCRQYGGEPFSLFDMYTGWAGFQYLSYDGHPGIDYHGIEGETAIIAPADGVMYAATEDIINGVLCNTFIIDHGNGYQTWYLHSDELPDNMPRSVVRNEVVAYVGTECDVPQHLHFEVRKEIGDGKWVPVDPYGWHGLGNDPYVLAEHNEDLWIDWSPPEQQSAQSTLGTGVITAYSELDTPSAS